MSLFSVMLLLIVKSTNNMEILFSITSYNEGKMVDFTDNRLLQRIIDH